MVNWLIAQALGGIPPALISSRNLADEYLNDTSYRDQEHRVRAMVNWESSKNFTSGFLTGIGGLLTLPVAVPAALGASWFVQARFSAAIAQIYDHDLTEDRVRTLVLLSLVGDGVKEVFKRAGIQIGTKVTQQVIAKIPGRLLIEINKQVGFRLLTKAGTTGVVNLIKWVPVVGGVIGGSIDGYACRKVGWAAQSLFQPDPPATP